MQNTIELELFGIYNQYCFGDRKLSCLNSTDFYYRTSLFPEDLCLAYRFILTNQETGETRTISDPLNANIAPTGEIKSFTWSVLELHPDEPDWYTKQYEDTGSRVETITITILDNTWNVYVYLPPTYDATNATYPVLYLFDAFIYLNRVEVPHVLDNLIYEQKMEPMITVIIDNPTNTSWRTELPMNPLFRDFMVTELIPEVRNWYKLTHKPEETIGGDMSYGGLAAAYLRQLEPRSGGLPDPALLPQSVIHQDHPVKRRLYPEPH